MKETSECLSHQTLRQLSEMIASRVGLHFPEARWPELQRGISAIAHDLQFDDLEACVRWLISSGSNQVQIETLAAHLTVGETYFFRDAQSFATFEQRVLPDVLKQRRGKDRHLKIWSVGCCTGEEAYSIAIVLERLHLELKDWRATILATDINPQFIKKAREGVYGEWSFRGVDPRIKDRYFTRTSDGRFEILPEIKRFVEFSFLNLADDNYPSPLNNTHDMDVIFCRNVLMYVAADQAERIIQRLHQSLLANRWLIVTPNETSQISRSQFNAATFPGVSFYKKGGDSQPLGTYPDKVNPRLDSADANVFITRQNETVTDASGVESGATRARRINLQEAEPSLLAGALDLYQAGRYDQARQILMMHLEQKPCDFKAMDLLARIYANQGKLKEARGWCEKVLRLDKMNPGSHVLHATILEEQGAIEKASRAFQRALYLDQNLIVAHFALGNIARKQQKIRDAARHFENACLLLRTYGREQILPESEGMTAGRMLEIIHYAGGVSGEIHQAAVENQFMTGRQTTLWPSRGGKNGE